MECLPLEDDGTVVAYTPVIPGIRTHRVDRLSCTLKNYVASLMDPGAVRVPEDLGRIRLDCYLVCRKDATADEKRAFMLNRLGVELAGAVESRPVWVARYDGRTLRPWWEVKAPVQQRSRTGPVPGNPMGGPSSGCTLPDLFASLMSYQNLDRKESPLLIIDETGLPKEVNGQPNGVCAESVYWRGPEAVEIARKWFADEFGVTFTEETRPVTVYDLKRRDDPK